MTPQVGLAILGLLLVALGLVLSPFPWLAAAIPGAVLFAVSFVVEVEE